MNNGPDFLSAVAFAAPNSGWAVGRGLPTSAIERWDGRDWSLVPGADLGERGTELEDVAAVGEHDVWAVGMSTPPDYAGGGAALVEHWNGTEWKAEATREVGQSLLNAVAAVSRKDVWAVGKQIYNTLIEHWNGIEWQVFRSPVAPQGDLEDIDAVSARDIWAVGSRGPPWPAPSKPLLQHWDGKTWRLVQAPVDHRYSMTSIAEVSSRDIWISASGPHDEMVVMHRVGSRWRNVRVPHIRGQYELILAAVAGRDDIWAIAKVAYYSDTAARIEHYHCRA